MTLTTMTTTMTMTECWWTTLLVLVLLLDDPCPPPSRRLPTRSSCASTSARDSPRAQRTTLSPRSVVWVGGARSVLVDVDCADSRGVHDPYSHTHSTTEWHDPSLTHHTRCRWCAAHSAHHLTQKMVAFCTAHNNTRDTHMCTARQSTPSLTRHLSSLTATSFHSPNTSLLPRTMPKPSSRTNACQAEICVTTFTESPDCDSIRRLIQDVEPTELLLSPALHPDMSRAVREVTSEQVRWLGSAAVHAQRHDDATPLSLHGYTT
jgi:hypothetical protein